MRHTDPTPGAEPTTARTARPTAILMAEHRVIETVLECLERIADTARGPDGLKVDDASRAVDFLQTFADACHHGKEEALLFPMLERHGLPAEMGPTAMMRAEHDLGRRHVREMAAALERAGADASSRETFVLHARAFVQLLRDHIQKEDHVLFPMADDLIPPEGQAELLAGFGRVEEHDVGTGVHEEYLALAQDLCARYGVTPREPPAGGGGCCAHG